MKTIDQFAADLAADSLRRFEFERRRAARLATPEAIHDLRVSMRRLSHCLRLFRQFLPKRLRLSLKPLMSQAARVRDCDVALALLEKAGVAAGSLPDQRDAERRALIAALKRWKPRSL